MLPIYGSFFGLKEAPFNITPDPKFLFDSSCHQEGLAQLKYGIEARRGFIVLTGEVGTGKTTLLQTLLQQLGGETKTALIFSAIENSLDLLRYVCEEFSLSEPTEKVKDTHDYICLLNNFLLQEYRHGRNVALIFDEAQNLSPEVLESVRLLSNFETTKDKLLQILLVGQPELNSRLNTPELRQLKQRVALRHRLRALTLKECEEYIVARLQCAGVSSVIFSHKAVEAIHYFSTGIPRLINVICDNSMISAYALEKRTVDVRLIEEVAEDLSLQNNAIKPRFVENDESTVAVMATVGVTQSPISKEGKSVQPEIQSRSESSSPVPEGFFVLLREALIDVIGPMGKVILSEQLHCLGGSTEHFPREKIDCLIESLMKEIVDAPSRVRFHKGISQGIRTFQ
jgi:general secretion pathway protein A